ncbi:MAG: prenyltransferase/squalene oxidase repeat-containing protein [Pirellulales bacterium]
MTTAPPPATADAPSSAPPAVPQFDPPDRGEVHSWRQNGMSWLVSLCIHMTLLLVLGLWVLPSQLGGPLASLELRPGEAPLPSVTQLQDSLQDSIELSPELAIGVQAQPLTENVMPEIDFAPLDTPESVFTSSATPELDLDFSENTDPTEILSSDLSGALSGRTEDARAARVELYGGTPGSERAVARALKWLAAHQLEDGGWSFDHRTGECQGRCPHPGRFSPARNGATAIALLPFLGAGHTHRQGAYRRNVEAGLNYLVRSMQLQNDMGSLAEQFGFMYSHGLAAIALCEAYAMTKDPALREPAQRAINYIVYAQDPVGGGWRYVPQMPGDTSMVGWQLMALKSAHMAGLKVPAETIVKTSQFLDSVQSDGGAIYGYVGKTPGEATSAIGLLCRMYLGWKRDHDALQRGMQHIQSLGPVSGNVYYTYYAAQVVFHYTQGRGSGWKAWNEKMREHLVKTQATEDHLEGSWYESNTVHGPDQGGRLYCTAMSAMILEIYYRHMPIYGYAATESEFAE